MRHDIRPVVRYIGSVGEHAYLEQNMERLLSLLANTPANDLLLVGNEGVPPLCASRTVYLVAVDAGDTVAREFVRKNGQLQRILLFLNYPLTRRLRNYERYRRSTRSSRRSSPKDSQPRALRPLLSLVLGEEWVRRLLSLLRGGNARA